MMMLKEIQDPQLRTHPGTDSRATAWLKGNGRTVNLTWMTLFGGGNRSTVRKTTSCHRATMRVAGWGGEGWYGFALH